MARVKRLVTLRSRGCTVECRGTSKTSSNVSPGSGRINIPKIRPRPPEIQAGLEPFAAPGRGLGTLGIGGVHGLVHDRLGGGGDAFHDFPGALHDAHRAADRPDREPDRAHRILGGLREPGEETRGSARLPYLLSRNSM